MRLNAKFVNEYAERLDGILSGHYISHPDFLTGSSVFFKISGEKASTFGIILDQQLPRVYISKIEHQSAQADSNFASKIKSELNNAFVKNVSSVNGDMIIRLDLEIINKVFKEEARHLYIELVPHHPNMILCDGTDKIIDVFRPMSLTSKRPLARNLIYEFPPKPTENEESSSLSVEEYESYCLSLEDALFASRKKERFGDHIKSLKRRLSSAEKKERAIQNDIKKAEDHLNDSEKANIIYTCFNEIKQGMTSIIYEGTKVDLDPLLSPSENAQRYFSQEKKAKSTIENAKANLDRARKEIDQLKSTLYLFENGDDAKLAQWIKDNKPKAKARNINALSSKELPYRCVYDGTTYMFGKNGVQNRYLTFFLSRSKNHIWLHIEGDHGSHLLIQKDNPSEKEINLAAEMIIFLSGREDGVVQIASRGDIRQGNTLGQVILKEYRVKRVSSVSPLAKDLVNNATKL